MSTSAARRPVLWVSLLGGSIAWLVHFMVVYVIAEWGCVPAPLTFGVSGVTATAVLLIGVSVVGFLAAAGTAVVAYRALGRVTGSGDEGGGRFMLRTGLMLNVIFAFIIAAESVPIFYFLSNC